MSVGEWEGVHFIGEWEGVHFRAGVHGGGLSCWSGSGRYTAVKRVEIHYAVPANSSAVGSAKYCWMESF